MGILNKIFNKGKALEPFDLSALKVDVHSHFIPGLDDGAQTIEESVALITQMKELGFQKIITTPHVMCDYFKNTSEVILEGLEKVKEALKKEKIEIDIEVAAEYNLDIGFEEIIKNRDILSFGGENKYVLFELSFYEEPDRLKDVIWELASLNYKPVLAHVERYPYWHKKWEKIEDIVNRDVKLQLNIGSLTGAYGPLVKNTAIRLIDNGMVDLIGSDCHNMRHIEMIKQAITSPYFHKLGNQPNLINKHL